MSEYLIPRTSNNQVDSGRHTYQVIQVTGSKTSGSVRVKGQKFSPGSNSALSGAFRNIAVNLSLRVIGSTSIKHRIITENHLCCKHCHIHSLYCILLVQCLHNSEYIFGIVACTDCDIVMFFPVYIYS